MIHATETAPIPVAWVGPLRVRGATLDGDHEVPLATFETPLWSSVRRGARLSILTDGILATVVDERMTRSVLLAAQDAAHALAVWRRLETLRTHLQEVVAQTSSHARLVDMHRQIAGNLLFLRFEFTTGDAAGHNMVTLAADRIMADVLARFPRLSYGSVSGNYCVDKKASAVNGILGRGRNVVAELTVPHRLVERFLHTTPEAIATLNTRKNLIGSTLAGSIRSANAHYANMLLAFFLATGQDAANIVEGSQGITGAEVRGTDLAFSCTLPNIIVGTVGSGKDLPFVVRNLERLGVRTGDGDGADARRLAVLCAATVLCGELSLLAAQTNPGELMAAHLDLERSQQ